MYIISGCNGSGKTTASYTILPELLDCSEFVNSDEFAKSLAPFHPETAYIKASRYMLEKTQYLFGRREDFCIETTLATRSLLKIVRRAQEQGYFVTVVYLWIASPEHAIQRVASRVSAGGHDVPEEIIRRRYYVGLQYFFNDYAPLCDKWILVDNTVSAYEIIAEGTHRSTTVRNRALYDHIQSMHDSP